MTNIQGPNPGRDIWNIVSNPLLRSILSIAMHLFSAQVSTMGRNGKTVSRQPAGWATWAWPMDEIHGSAASHNA